jgi:hypothetical protein
MTPKVKSAQGTKCKSGPSQPKKSNRPIPFDGNRFLTAAHSARFNELCDRTFWHDKQFQLSPTGAYKGLLENFEKRKWGKLLDPHIHINMDIVREFYANALPIDEDGEPSEELFTFTTKVRGRSLSFDREAINTYLGNPMPLRSPDELCAFHRKQNQGNWDHDLIQRTNLKEGCAYEISQAGRAYRALKNDMNIPAQVVFKLIIHNIRPKSHVFSTPVENTPLIYSILAGISVDVARIIANELKIIALNGVFGPKCPLAFPGLVMGLVLGARISIPAQVHEIITHPINDTFIARVMDKKVKESTQASRPSSSRARRAPQTTPTTQPLDFSDFDPRLQACYSYTWDQNDASYRAMAALQNSMYRM